MRVPQVRTLAEAISAGMACVLLAFATAALLHDVACEGRAPVRAEDLARRRGHRRPRARDEEGQHEEVEVSHFVDR